MSKYNSIILNIIIKNKRGIKRERQEEMGGQRHGGGRREGRGGEEEAEKQVTLCVPTRCHPIAVLTPS